MTPEDIRHRGETILDSIYRKHLDSKGQEAAEHAPAAEAGDGQELGFPGVESVWEDVKF